MKGLVLERASPVIDLFVERGESMIMKFLKFNLKLLPAYVFLTLVFISGIVLTADKETYTQDMAAVIAQITVVLLIPNIIYLIKNRKKSGIFIAFLVIVPIIPLPFIIIAGFLRI
ncbi:hypothetical protein D3H55_20415 [Bacillus salacetis]|uniref:Uncharacterized protein n=1 Tax=Bacillus salacetis TaxID=2315464 RepID=A0A3A1QUY9_9BACI|nr:hypothetical protein [Bacillus salacetis]RIW28932.1 hypothetical protein D3H55_20415 [Bacillus salacetis]